MTYVLISRHFGRFSAAVQKRHAGRSTIQLITWPRSQENGWREQDIAEEHGVNQIMLRTTMKKLHQMTRITELVRSGSYLRASFFARLLLFLFQIQLVIVRISVWRCWMWHEFFRFRIRFSTTTPRSLFLRDGAILVDSSFMLTRRRYQFSFCLCLYGTQFCCRVQLGVFALICSTWMFILRCVFIFKQ